MDKEKIRKCGCERDRTLIKGKLTERVTVGSVFRPSGEGRLGRRKEFIRNEDKVARRGWFWVGNRQNS